MEKGTRELHTAPDPTSTVPCPLRSREHIAMGRCVEYQRDNGCHCEHALTALRRTEKHLQSPTGLLTAYDSTARADALDGVHALIERAEAMEKARPQAAVEPPPAPRRPDARPPPVPFIRPTLVQTYREATRIEVAEAVLATRATRQTPAPPAKEPVMAKRSCSCGKEIRRDYNGVAHEKCRKCRVAAGEVSDRKSKPARATKAAPALVKALPARKPAPAPPPTRSAPPADIISLLEHQLGHHEEQAEKCRKALQALR